MRAPRELWMAMGLAMTAGVASGADWPQWMGPGRDDIWRETGVVKTLPKEGLKILWRTPIAGGYAGPAVVGRHVYVTDYKIEGGSAVNDPSARPKLSGAERVFCLDAETGATIWKHEYPCEYEISYPAGPRATPAVDAGMVYTLGAEGMLLCLDAAKGTKVWGIDLKKEYKIAAPVWGFSGHPLVDGEKLLCLVGGEGSIAVAFDKKTGKELWRALSAPEPGYCPPTIIEAGGTRQLLIWHPQSVNALDPETGKVLWTEALQPLYGMSIAAPRRDGAFLFASGYGNAAVTLKLSDDKPAASVVWRGKNTNAVYCVNSTPFIEDGVIYGADGDTGALRAVRLSDGKRLWETFKPTTGGDRRLKNATAFLTKNDDRFFLFAETGDLIIAKLSAEKYEEASRARLLEPTNEVWGRPVVWSHPAYAGRRVYARNDKEIVCASLAE